ncbi:4'-phosphopantetheinyl transferase family protein [Streptomyces sp. CA-135486]|uniref:4'-phosphopantetheinyl transferase family protein n=1 Tax=Streptomyces sp. CA-135486 TaxID=3240049 RepID=UPI003D8BC77C
MGPRPAGSPLRIEAGPGVWAALTYAPSGTGLLTTRDRADAMRLPTRRRIDRLGARGLLRALLSERFPEAATAAVEYEPSGRPVLLDHPRIGISVSHSNGAYAACVALDRAVGIDVQPPPSELADPLLRWCTPNRQQELTALPPHRRATEFAWIWTVKEACGKALGTGLADATFTLDVPCGTARGTWGPYQWVSLRKRSPLPLSCAFSSITKGEFR